MNNCELLFVKCEGSVCEKCTGFHIEKGMDAKKLDKMTNEEVIGYLTDIKGVGRWTVEMLLSLL